MDPQTSNVKNQFEKRKIQNYLISVEKKEDIAKFLTSVVSPYFIFYFKQKSFNFFSFAIINFARHEE